MILPISFRQGEVLQLLNWVRAGESASVVGVSGMGKSNLFNYLLDPAVQAACLGPAASHYLFLRINFHYGPDFTERVIYSLILEQLELIADSVQSYHEALLDAGGDSLKVQRYFRLALRPVMAAPERKLVLLFDQFDEVYQRADDRLFACLRGLREAYKYRLAFLVFSRDTLPALAENSPGREEFYELLATNLLGLQPYNRDDSLHLLQRLADRHHLPLPVPVAEQLLTLTGGHAGLLRATCLAVLQGGADPEGDLLSQPAVGHECQKLWHSLSLEEQQTLANVAWNRPAGEGLAQQRLQLKGLLTTATNALFSPLFGQFARNQEAAWERAIYLDERTRQVWVLGRPITRLTSQEFKLFAALYARPGELLLKDELVDIGWPTAHGHVSDETLTATMSRLRKKLEPEPDKPRFLETVRGQGYLLKNSDL